MKLPAVAIRANSQLSHPTWVRGLKQSQNTALRLVQPVAPYVGAWIETHVAERHRPLSLSHPTWVRGLKQRLDNLVGDIVVSHPTWVRGLKLLRVIKHKSAQRSHPTWVRGLKQCLRISEYLILWSHPTWVRGLKLLAANTSLVLSSRTLRGCVD